MKSLNNLKKNIYVLLVLSASIIFFNNCSPLDSITPSKASNQTGACDLQKSLALEAEVIGLLAAAVNSVDFAIQFENRLGRQISYNRNFWTMATPIESASSSKWISASVILHFLQSPENLNSSNPLRLDSKPQDFLTSEEWSIPEGDPLRNIQLSHLLSFTSGLANEPSCIKLGLPITHTLSSCVRLVSEANIANGRVPGAAFYYNGSHLHVAGLMAQRARNEIKNDPLGTWNDLFAEFKLSTGTLGEATFNLPTVINPRIAGGLSLTGLEYMGFLRAFHKRQLFSETKIPGSDLDLHDLQFLDHRSEALTENSAVLNGPLALDWHYGFGLWLECIPGPIPYDCSSETNVFSSAGAYGSYPFIDVKNQYFGFLSQMARLGSGFEGHLIAASARPKLEEWARLACPPDSP